MIKNINDFLSIITLLFITIYCVRLFIWSFVKFKDNKDNEDNKVSKYKLIKEYLDNTEE